MDIKNSIRAIADFPIEGIVFRDITTLMQDAAAFQETCRLLYEHCKTAKIDKIVGIEARGFIFGAVLAQQLGAGFVPVRKKGKLPFHTIRASYSLEYGENIVEIHQDAIQKGERVLIIDDVLATGGTMRAAIDLTQRLGGDVVECAVVIELLGLGGRERLQNFNVFSVVQFD